MIIGFIGLPAEGKTLGMVFEACKALKAGRRVISNIPIVDTVNKSGNSAEYVNDIGNAIANENNALICIDEASIVLPNYFWEKMSFDTLIRFAQVRKYGMDIYYTSQGWNHTVKRLRDLTNYVVRCKNHTLWFSFDYFDPEFFVQRIAKHFEKDYIVKTVRIFKPSFQKIFNAYNTMFIVTNSMLVKNKKENDISI